MERRQRRHFSPREKVKIFEAHRTGRREAHTYLKDFVLEKLEVPDWPLDPMPKPPRQTPPPLPPDC
jgi:hypothetical protein